MHRFLNSIRMGEITRYALNGIVATLAHYSALTFNIDYLGLSSAGSANFFAAIVGITVSFVGSRYFVFRNFNESIYAQAFRFGSLYGAIAVLHGITLLIWSDILHYDYRFGFIIATALQVSLSYIGNKVLVFKT